MIDLPKPPDHIIVDIKPVKGIKWPQGLNLSPNSNLIRIPIGLTSWCKKKVKVGTQESATYYAHAVDLAFAITVWKCQGGTFDYIIALLEHTLGSPTLTFEKLMWYLRGWKGPVDFDVYHYLQHSTNESYITYTQKFLPQNGEWILTKVGVGNHIYLILLHCRYQKHQKLLQHVKKEIMFPLSHLSLKIFSNRTAFNVIFVDSPIFNRNIVNEVSNMIQWKYFITTTYSNKSNIEEKYVTLLTNLFFTTIVMAASSDNGGSMRQQR